MNPRLINSLNIVQFGFAALVNTETRKIVLDASMTQYTAGGAAKVKGINFEIVDPANVKIAVIDFPSKDIDPAAGQTSCEFDLASGIALFGWYNIKGVIMDADGTTYEVVLPPKEVCEPKGYNVQGDFRCPAFFDVKVNCEYPFIRISQTTPFVYMGKEAKSKVLGGVVYYPRGTEEDLLFTQTPFETQLVYTGDYVLRAKTTATYDLGDNFFVSNAYGISKRFDVICQDRIVDVLCCIEQKRDEMRRHVGDSIGVQIKEQLESCAIPLIAAISKERCGKDASREIGEIKRILACDCGCSDSTSKLIESSLVSAGVSNVVVKGIDAATVGAPLQENGNSVYSVKVKNVLVAKGVLGDSSYKIDKIEDDHSIVWKITFDYKALSANILNTIGSDANLKSLLTSLVVANGASSQLIGFDGKCIINTSDFEYAVNVPFVNRTFVGIEIDNMTYPVTTYAGFDNTKESIQGFLNSLNKGVFNVSIVSGSLIILATANGILNRIVLRDATVQPFVDYSIPFEKQSKTVQRVLQAIIDYLCAITTATLKLGTDQLVVLSITQAGTLKTTAYGADVSLRTYLTDLSASFATMVQKLAAIPKVDCSTVSGLFKTIEGNLAGTDTLFGLKAGSCSGSTIRDIAIALFKLAQTDAGVAAEFCKITCQPVSVNCGSLSSIVAASVLE